MKRMRPLLIICIVLLAAIVTLSFGLKAYHKHEYGTLQLVIQAPSAKNITATINGKPLTITSLQASYTLSTGKKVLRIDAPNYHPFSTSFTITGEATEAINASLVSAAPQDPTVALQQISTSLTSILPTGFYVQSATYFYGNTWTVAIINNSQNDSAIIVAQYASTQTAWKLLLGPGTLFPSTSLTGLPSQVVSYMNAQDYTLNQ
jgi:hypothetical protein